MHATYTYIDVYMHIVMCVPYVVRQYRLPIKCGTVYGLKCNNWLHYTELEIPNSCIRYITCTLHDITNVGTVCIPVCMSVYLVTVGHYAKYGYIVKFHD